MNFQETLSNFEEELDSLEPQTLQTESPKPTENSEPTPNKPKKKKKKLTEKNTVILNVGDTVYAVVRYVGKKMLKWKLQYDKEAMNWDVYWTDCAVQAETLGKMQPYQKINHFPGMYSLARKNHLGRNLMKMAKQFPDNYKFFPKTWLLPAEYGDFRSQFQKGKQRTFIVKPEASCQGRGIFLTRDIDDVSPTEHYVAQRYLTNPYLIDGLKFDLRIYVLLAGCDPLRIYIYKEGLARFATEDYEAPNKENIDNVCMHLTNYAINKDNENFVFNEDEKDMSKGHKRSLTSVFDLLRSRGENVDQLWKTIKQMMVKTFCAVQPILCHHYKSCQPDNFINNMCFEVLGMDVILNSKLKPFLLEVNHTPSFTTDTPLDAAIKRSLISDALKLMNVSVKQRNEIINERKEVMQQRVLTGKKAKLSPNSKQQMIDKGQKQRDQWEHAHLGGFEIVYPTHTPEDQSYQPFLDHAKVLYEEQTGARTYNIRRNNKKTNSIAPQMVNSSHISTSSSQQQPPKNSKSQDLQKIYANRQKLRSVEKKTSPKDDQIQSPIRFQRTQSKEGLVRIQQPTIYVMKRVPIAKQRDVVQVINDDEPTLQEKYTQYLKKQKEIQYDTTQSDHQQEDKKQEAIFSQKIFQSNNIRVNEAIQRTFQQQQQQQQLQQQQQQVQGNYLTPKVFQIHGASTSLKDKLVELKVKKH